MHTQSKGYVFFICYCVFIIGNQTKDSDSGKAAVNAEESSKNKPSEVESQVVGSVKTLVSAETKTSSTMCTDNQMTNKNNLPTIIKNNQPAVYNSTECNIVRPTPKHPEGSQDVNRRMSVSKSTSSLSASQSSQRLTRSRSAVTVEESLSNRLPEKRKRPQDLENIQKKAKSGEKDLKVALILYVGFLLNC